jgi:hypothetical protein
MRIDDRCPWCGDRILEPRHYLSHLSRQQGHGFQESRDHRVVWGLWGPTLMKILGRLLEVGFGLSKSIRIFVGSPGDHVRLLSSASARTWPLDPRPWQSSSEFGHVRQSTLVVSAVRPFCSRLAQFNVIVFTFCSLGAAG